VAERLKLLDQLDATADAIAESEHPRTWPCWLSYILEVLEDKTGEEEYVDSLKRLGFAITARLDTGEW
jgi:hypothetical protein